MKVKHIHSWVFVGTELSVGKSYINAVIVICSKCAQAKRSEVKR